MKKFLVTLFIVLSVCNFSFSQEAVSNQENAEVQQNQTRRQAQNSQQNQVARETKKPAKIDALEEYRKGRDLKNLGKTAEANASFKKCIDACYSELREKPNNIESYVVLTWALLGEENYRTCITECQKALKIYSDNRIIETIGEAYFYNGQYEQSIKAFEQYVANLPNSDRVPRSYFFMGEAYRILRQYEHADIAYSNALLKQPRLPLWWYRLGQVKEKTGDIEGAKNAYQQTVKLSPNHPDATAALKRL